MAHPSGIFVMDKPAGMSSAKLVAIVKRVLGVKKAGHTGTLDPFATGVMICCVNQATRLARYFLGGDKSYEAVFTLGVETDTQDVTGSVTATSTDTHVTRDEIASVLDTFEGDIQQVPPVYSALKHQGTRLYKLARQGRPVQKPPRQVHISSIDLLAVALPDVRIQVTCSAGTYIRTLCADIGVSLGCGAHLKQLRRTAACGFGLDEALKIQTLEAFVASGNGFEKMVPMAETLRGFPEVVVTADVARSIRHGIPLSKNALDYDDVCGGNPIKVVDRDHRLLAIITSYGGKSTYDYECVLGA